MTTRQTDIITIKTLPVKHAQLYYIKFYSKINKYCQIGWQAL